MKHGSSLLVLFAFSAFGCAVASVDPDPNDSAGVGDGDGDGDGDGNTGGNVIVMSGGTSGNMGSGGTLGSGGSSGTGTGGTLSTGGAQASGGQSAGSGGSDPSGCVSLGSGDKNTGHALGTTEAVCFIVDYADTMYGWRCNHMTGRTVTVNGEVQASGVADFQSNEQNPWPGGSPYLVEISAGSDAGTDFAFW